MASIAIKTQHLPFCHTRYKVVEKHVNPVAKFFKAAFNSLRSVDGIDELSSAAGQALPGIGAPLVSLGILAPATPFVAAGAAGAVSESVERFRDLYPKTLQGLLERQENILKGFESLNLTEEALAGLKKSHDRLERLTNVYLERQNAKTVFGALKSRSLSEIKKTLKAKNPFDQNGGGNISRRFLIEARHLAKTLVGCPDALRHELVQYERQEIQRHIEHIDRDCSVPGSFAMVGMTAGMLPATAGAVADVVKESAAAAATSAAAGAAAGTLGTVAGAVFLPAQVAMAGYGASKAITGGMREHQFKKDKKAIEALAKDARIDLSTAKSVIQGINRKRYYNAHHSISYGVATSVGQGFMMAGNIGTMSGVGAPIAGGLFAVGVPLTLGAAAQRFVYERKEANFVGEGASEAAQALAEEQNIDSLFMTHQNIFDATRCVEKKYKEFQNKLARVKLFSLENHALKKEEKGRVFHRSMEHIPAERSLKMAQMVLDGKKNLFKGTTLLEDDLTIMQDIYEQEERKNMRGPVAEVREKMIQRLMASEGASTVREMIDEKVLSNTVKKLEKKSKHNVEIAEFLESTVRDHEGKITTENIEELAKRDKTVRQIYQSELATRFIKQAKKDMKSLRDDAHESLIRGAMTIQSLKKTSD